MKTEINTILLATNFMPGSRRTLDYAVSLAKRLKAKLVIVNAFELDPEANSVELADHMPSRTRLEWKAWFRMRFCERSRHFKRICWCWAPRKAIAGWGIF
jgi:hypothetical protein